MDGYFLYIVIAFDPSQLDVVSTHAYSRKQSSTSMFLYRRGFHKGHWYMVACEKSTAISFG